MMTMQDFRRMAAAMDQRARQLAAEGVRGPELINRMMGHLLDLHRIWTGTSDRQLIALSNEYPGFYQYASMMEEAAEAERKKPYAPYRGLPQLPEALKPMLANLLTNAATLEREYQTVIDTTNRHGIGAQLDELHKSFRNWLGDRERFVVALKEAGVSEIAWNMISPAIDQMADRIAQLKTRAVAE